MSGDKESKDQSLASSDPLGDSPFSSELIQNLPQEKRAEFIRALAEFRVEIEQVEQYAGPIPHPSHLLHFQRMAQPNAVILSKRQ